MTRWMTGIAAFCMLAGVASAQEAIVVVKVAPESSAFKNSSWDKPTVIKSSTDAGKYFSKDALKKLETSVDFKKQFVLVFAWRGSGRDELSYNVAESYPEQISFSLKRGRTRDLLTHTNVYALRSNVRWSAKGKVATAVGTSRAPTKPLAERVQEAEMIFLGKVVNKVVDGDWAQAELLVEQPVSSAEKGAKVAVTWRIKTGRFLIYDVADGTRGVAILKDKHKGRYWLRGDKFENPDKLASVMKEIGPKALEVTVTPDKPYVLPDGKTQITVKKESIYLGRGGRSGTVQVMVGDSVMDVVPRTVIAAGGYRFEFNTATKFQFGEVRQEDMIFTVVDACTLTVIISKQPSPHVALKKLKDTVELDCFSNMPCLEVHTIRGERKHFVSFKPTQVTISRFHPSPVLAARLKMNVINNFGAKAITLDYMKKTQVTIGPETITLESFDFNYAAKKIRIRISTVPKTAKAPATVLDYGGKPAGPKADDAAEFIRVKADGKYTDAKLPIAALAKGESVEVQVKGKLTDGMMAIGGETTGTVIRSRKVTWELDVSGPGLKKKAATLSGKTVVVTGAVRQKAGVEIAKRTILVVKTLEEG